MNFLQPWMLYALPLIALPIIIHLINQRRYRTIQWAAMMFLLAANRMSRGYARIRQWLILAARTLAVAGLIFAVSRPLTSGWLSLAGSGRPDTTLILVDRSPSMQQQGAGGRSKLVSGLEKLTQSLGLIGSQRWVLVDSANPAPVEFLELKELPDLVQSAGVSSSSDLPAMLQAALTYLQENRPGRSEIWICSDVRQNDWDAESGRWSALRDAFLAMPQPVRIHLLSYSESAPQNRSIRVTEVRRLENTTGAELLVSLQVAQDQVSDETVTVPVQFEIDGSRSEVSLELRGKETDLQSHSISLNENQVRGWGRVSIPADVNLSDNQFYFVYDRPVPRKTIIVCDDPEAAHPLQLAAAISPEAGLKTEVETLKPEELAGTEWETASLVLWQADLPEGAVAEQLQTYAGHGGQLIFFPPEDPSETAFAGVSWGDWKALESPTAVATWVGDQDLLARTKSGTALPVGQLQVNRTCELIGDVIPLAQLQGNEPLLARAVTTHRGISFCTTTAAASDSSLARDGVVFYIMIQRALAAGASSQGSARQLIAGQLSGEETSDWQQLAGSEDALSSTYAQQAGVYQDGDRLMAVNRSQAEDGLKIVSGEQVVELFKGLDFNRIDEQIGRGNPLLAEVWRFFLMVMMASLLLEAFLCIPRSGTATSAAESKGHRGFPSTQGVPA
ncbi:BatA domain-containing protein [Planctomicrobium sp. SH661]|uniref:BatA domain-containing protein n=1 Tax=Planctomicrobium sp. SH661 TaxID=3448124 RepID=UPI003F5B8F3E